MFDLIPKPDYQKIETEVLEFWRKNKIFEQSIERRPSNQPFVFYEGPPTANGKPGLHHVLARAYKDIICRYRTMKGYRVKRQAGWDTHGLPVELEIEKELGVSGKGEIENLIAGDAEKSIIKFNQLCQASVFRYKKDWERLTERIGFWLDMKNPYITYQNAYIEKLWEIIKKIWDQKLLYRGYKVLPYCYRCETALSSHEVAQGYKEITEPSVYVKFRVKGKKNLHLLAWTTTPWTLAGNVALAVGKDIVYLQVKTGNEELILAEQLAKKVLKNKPYQPVKKLTGADLAGWEYQPLYDVIPLRTKDKYRVITADFVSTQEGTGIVHTAVMYGEDDYRLADKYALPKYHTVDKTGKFIQSVPKFGGQNVHRASAQIVKDLSDRNLILQTTSHTHSYPFCWRCNSQLIYYAQESWLIKMSVLRSQLVSNNQQINWVPQHIKEGRFGKWLGEVKDWALSRERYWGTPLPIWLCQTGKPKTQNPKPKINLKSKIKNRCHNIEVIGSPKELMRKSVQPIDIKKLDLHRPHIDRIKLKCEKCGGEMERDKSVIDVWFDSGAMPFASKADKKLGYPADYITEAIDQTRGWFYTLLAISTLLGRGASYKNVICLGHILDDRGRKMSKSLGNIIEPNQILDEFGADNLRMYLFSLNQPGRAKRFSRKDLLTSSRQNLMLVWNMILFFKTYSKIDQWQFKPPTSANSFLDSWLKERASQLIRKVDKDLDKYQVTDASRKIESFINQLSTWYLKLSRQRRDQDFYDNFYQALLILVKLMAPFMPFSAEYFYQNLRGAEGGAEDLRSVHWLDFPVSDQRGEENLEKAERMRRIISQASAIRQQQGIRLRQPLKKLELRIENLEFSDEELEILRQETNVLEIKLRQGKGLKVELDTLITPQLRQLGLLRDLKRQIQNLRKKALCRWDEKVTLAIGASEQNQWIKKYHSEIEKETLTQIVSDIQAPTAQADFQGFKLKIKKNNKPISNLYI